MKQKAVTQVPVHPGLPLELSSKLWIARFMLIVDKFDYSKSCHNMYF